MSTYIDTTDGDALVPFAHVLVHVGGPSRAEIAGRALEARILLALVTQMPRQRATVGEGAPAGVGAEKFLVRCLTPHGQAAVFERERGQPDVMGIDACNRRPVIDSAQSATHGVAYALSRLHHTTHSA